MSTVRYVPGAVPTVIGLGFAVMVDRADSALVEQLWEISLREPDLVRVLEILGAEGFSQMPAFAAIAWNSDSASVVYRGDVTLGVASEHGTETTDARDVSTWVERRFELQNARGLRFDFASEFADLPNAFDASPLPVTGGVVFASTIFIGDEQYLAGEQNVAAEDDGVPDFARGTSEELAPEAPVSEDPAEGSAAELDESSLGEEKGSADVPIVSGTETVITPSLVSLSMTDPEATVAEPEDVSLDSLFGATIVGRKPEDAAVRDMLESDNPTDMSSAVPHEESVSEPVAEDERTMTPAEFAKLRATRSADATMVPHPQAARSSEKAAPAIAPIPTPARIAPRLVLSTGREIVVERSVLFGRAPQARNTAGADLPELVVLDDPYISGTHLEVAVSGNQLMATDMSTNGTLMIVPGTPPITLVRNEATPVPGDAILKVSEELSITVVVPS